MRNGNWLAKEFLPARPQARATQPPGTLWLQNQLKSYSGNFFSKTDRILVIDDKKIIIDKKGNIIIDIELQGNIDILRSSVVTTFVWFI